MRLSRRQFCVTTWCASLQIFFANLLAGFGCAVVKKAVEPDMLTTLAFGSCNKQDMLPKHWPIIHGKNAQGWLWMGDAIYADKTEPNIRAHEYQKVLNDKSYQELMANSFVMGTWDDHDYAENDAGMSYDRKIESQKVFLDFLGEPLDSARRSQLGIYTSKTVGKAESAIQFILLDMRYFKEEALTNSSDPLGAAQWSWLEGEILKTGPSLKIVVTSIQALTDYKGRDSWAVYPEAQARFIKILATSPVQILLLSGDRHLTEVMAREVSKGRLVHEITSSGITHFSDHVNENTWRVKEQISETNFGVLEFTWDKAGKPFVSGIKSSIYSPQTGALIREFIVPMKWS